MMERRGYLKYAGGAVVVAIVAAGGYGVYKATEPSEKARTGQVYRDETWDRPMEELKKAYEDAGKLIPLGTYEAQAFLAVKLYDARKGK